MRFMKVEVTGGNIRQGHFYINRDSGIVPILHWGGKNKLVAGKNISLRYEGDADTVDTDFDGEKRIPRFGRGQCRKFFERYGVKAGDEIYLVKESERKFLVSYSRP